jgi:glycosyltransferase involved in cell wall biosynthesis
LAVVTEPSADPPVAVVIAVRDSERYVAEAIDSVLAQTVPPAEIVVVDDGSEDGTPAILARYGAAISVLRQAPSGQFAAVNRGIAASKSPLLAFLDADDLFTPSSIEVRLRRLVAADRPDAVFGRTEQFVSPELTAELAARIKFDAGPMHGELFQTMLIRRVAFESVGPVEERLSTSSNIDWISRARARGIRSVEIDDVVARRRLHATNMGITHSSEKRDNLLEVIRAHHRRTRGSQREGER